MKIIFFFISVIFVTNNMHAQSGQLDSTFGTSGIVITDVGIGDFGYSTLVQPDGKIIVAGGSYSTVTHNDFTVIRYNSDGILDSTFSGDGIVKTNFGNDIASAAVLQNDGKIIAVGSSDYDFALVRYNSDGSLDNSFGSSGIVTTDFSADESANDVALLPDDKIIVAGYRQNGNSGDFALARYNSDGSLDTSFGSYGTLTTDFLELDNGESIAIQTDGKIVVSGYSVNNGLDWYLSLARYKPNGSLDSTFGIAGKVTVSFDGLIETYSMALQPDGKIIEAGFANLDTTGFDCILIRFNADGTLDNAFGNSGYIVTDFGTMDDRANSLVLQNDGSILIGGFNNDGYNGNFLLAAYSSDGVLDLNFGDGGKVVTDLGTDWDNGLCATLQPDGKIVLCGDAGSGLDGNFGTARYFPYVATGAPEFENPDLSASIDPNPISTITTICYKVSQNEIISIWMFDIYGRRIQTLLDHETQVVGRHCLNFYPDPSLPHGIYFLGIESSNNILINKVVK